VSNLLSITSASTVGLSPFGEVLNFDFSAAASQAGGQVLAYAVGLTGFCLNYQTNSPFWAEEMALLQVSLVPNLVGNVLYVSANALMSDYDGDAARPAAGGPGDPATTVQAIAVALVGTSYPSPPNEVVLGNYYQIPDKQSTSPPVSSNPAWATGLSGFSLVSPSGSGTVKGLSLGAPGTLGSHEVTITSTAYVNDFAVAGAVDAFIVAAPQELNLSTCNASISWGSTNGQEGLTGSLQASPILQKGQTIVSAFALLTSLTIVYVGPADFQLVSASLVGPLTIKDGSVTGQFNLNMYNPDFTHRTYIDSSSTASIMVLAQTAPSSAAAD
jgi:hypothetical protein